jgi:hypothetical protein
MKYASERGGMSTSVHDWKPCPPDRFAKLMHQYTTQYGDEHGHGALTMTAMKLDRISTSTIFYYPQNGKIGGNVRSPVLMTVSMIDGKIITFESLKYGFNVPNEGLRDETGQKVSADGVKIFETGINIQTTKIVGGSAQFSGKLTASNLKVDGAVTTTEKPKIITPHGVSLAAPNITQMLVTHNPSCEVSDTGGNRTVKIVCKWDYSPTGDFDGFILEYGSETTYITPKSREAVCYSVPLKDYEFSLYAYKVVERDVSESGVLNSPASRATVKLEF